jgi:ABC-type multidrug transport system permease subunit
MRFLWISTLKDLRRARRDPISFATWLGIPLLLMVMLNTVFGGGGGSTPLPKGRLLIADEDHSLASNVLTAAFGRAPLDQMVLVEKVNRREGRERIDRGDASAFLVIPQGLQQAFLHNQPFHLQLFTNPSQRISPQIVEETLSVMVEGGFYVQRAAAAELRTFDPGGAAAGGAGGAAELRAADSGQSAAIGAVYRRILSLRKGFDPPLIQLETSVIQEKKQAKSTAALFFPTMLFMAIWMIASAQAGDIWKERALGALRRVAVAPVRLSAFLGGRLVFVALVFGAVALAGLAVARWLGGVPVANLPVSAAWAMLSGTAFYLLMLLLTMQASNQHAAHVLVNLVAFPMALVGGCFFPFEIMPPWMAAVGRLTPNGWAVQQFSSIISGPLEVRGLVVALAGLTGVCALAFFLTLRRLRRSFAL